MKDMLSLFTLDDKGVLLACTVGLLILFFGQSYGLLFLVDMLVFLALSAVVTGLGKRRKEGIGLYEHARGWKNVLSNGLVPLLVAFMYFAFSAGKIPATSVAIIYIASVTAVTADKFSSEIGVLNGEPTMLLTLKRVKKGISGGVTGLGLLASLIGSLVISLSTLYMSGSLGLVVIVAISGFGGAIVDSVFGYFEEQGIGNKYTSNFLCAVSGAVICTLLLVL
jgi:uncharacterized protein (TIGR00297 family)